MLFCNTFDLHLAIIGLENQFLVFFLSGGLRQVLLYVLNLYLIATPFNAFANRAGPDQAALVRAA